MSVARAITDEAMKRLSGRVSRRPPRKLSRLLDADESKRLTRASPRLSAARTTSTGRSSRVSVRDKGSELTAQSRCPRKSRTYSISVEAQREKPPPPPPPKAILYLQSWSQLMVWRLRNMAFLPKLK
eukprot:6307228-Prymnesium_polylepis.1